MTDRIDVGNRQVGAGHPCFIIAEAGVNRVRLTGGEPLLRLDLFKLVERLRSIHQLNDIALTTNGALLAVLAAGGVEYQAWLKFALKWYLALMVLGAGVTFVAIAIGLQ